MTLFLFFCNLPTSNEKSYLSLFPYTFVLYYSMLHSELYPILIYRSELINLLSVPLPKWKFSSGFG